MSTNNPPRPEAITIAKWWGDVLRYDLLRSLQSIVADSNQSASPRAANPPYEARRLLLIGQVKEVIPQLTASRMKLFQRSLAVLVQSEMQSHHDFCRLLEGGRKTRGNDPIILQALVRARINPFPFSGDSLFIYPRATFTRVGEARAVKGAGQDIEACLLPIMDT